jgi:ATP-dependent DNA ligase
MRSSTTDSGSCAGATGTVRVFSRGGHDWSAQLPAIVATIQALPISSALFDGEGVICGPDGKSDFDRVGRRSPPISAGRSSKSTTVIGSASFTAPFGNMAVEP